MALDAAHERAISLPLSHDELDQLQRIAQEAGGSAHLGRQRHDLARAAILSAGVLETLDRPDTTPTSASPSSPASMPTAPPRPSAWHDVSGVREGDVTPQAGVMQQRHCVSKYR